MKYWVYKESRILGPFDKEGMQGLQGLDASTLVCSGDPDGGAWVPAGELSELGAPMPAPAYGSALDDSTSMLDRLQIDAAGLLGDDDFGGSIAEDLFRDASLKQGFGDALTSAPADDAAVRRERDRANELTFQLEAMYKRMSELEAGHTDLVRRLAEKEREIARLKSGAYDAAASFAPPPAAPAAFAPPPAAPATPPPDPLKPPPQSSVPTLPAAGVAPPSEWPVPSAPSGIPSFAGPAAPPPPAAAPVLDASAAADLPPPPPAPAPLSISQPPPMPSFAPPSGDLPPPPPIAGLPPVPEEAKPKTLSFGKPKTFKIVPTKKTFKIVGPADAAAAAPSALPPAPAPLPSIPPPPAPADLEPTMVAPSIPPPPAPTPAPAVAAPAAAEPAPEIFINAPPPAAAPEPAAAAPAPAPAAPTPAPVPDFGALDPLAGVGVPTPAPTPAPAPPNTLSRGLVSDMAGGDLAGSDSSAPPETMAVAGGAGGVPTPDVLARFAKPEAGPATEPPKKSARSNKPFLIGGGVLVVLLAVVGFIFMRQPKDEMKQMTSLDDGQGPMGAPSLDGGDSAPAMAKPRPQQELPPAPAPEPVAPAPPPGPPPEQQAAIDMVKDFPLDGGRGTVGRWLQYSYTGSPGAGAEEWSVSSTGDTWLVEYRMQPAAPGGKGALYLFEADVQRGLVMGKNLEARQMLAGSPPAEVEPVKKKAPAKAKKKPVKRRPVVEEPAEVPLLPLPDSGELRPPSEDDGSFGSDTIGSGI